MKVWILLRLASQLVTVAFIAGLNGEFACREVCKSPLQQL